MLLLYLLLLLFDVDGERMIVDCLQVFPGECVLWRLTRRQAPSWAEVYG